MSVTHVQPLAYIQTSRITYEVCGEVKWSLPKHYSLNNSHKFSLIGQEVPQLGVYYKIYKDQKVADVQ